MGLDWYRGVSRGQWLALAAALLGWMFDGFEQGIVPLLARPALVELLHLQEEARAAAEAGDAATRAAALVRVDRAVGAWNGRITAAFLVGAALGGWFFGWLGDRLGRVRAMALSVLVYSVFTGLGGLAQDAPQLAVLRFLAALGMGGEWALGVALVMETWPGEARPVLAGLIGAAANVGFFLTGLAVLTLEQAGLRVDAGGWRWVLGICAFPALLTFLLRLYVPESEKWTQAARSAPRPGLGAIFAPAVWRRTLMGVLLAGIPLIGTWGAIQFIPLWVKQQTGDQAMVNYAQMGAALGAVVGALGGALLGQRLGRRKAYFLLCFGAFCVTAYLFRGPLMEEEKTGGRFLALVTLTGALTASFYGWLPLYLPELFPTRIRATGQGFGYNAGRIIAAAGALSTSYLLASVFHGSYAQAAATITLIYLFGMAAIWLAPETGGQPLPE
jgi:MFS transporter, SHS family, sialic acid transporter